MTDCGALPGEPAAKLAYLQRGYALGQSLRPLLAAGAALQPVLDYIAAHPELTAERTGRRLAIRYGALVRWDATLEDGRIAGHGASGFGPLMEALGIDFGGNPYQAGNGNG